MQPITLIAVQKSVPAPGDFGAVVNGQTLEVPQCVVDCGGTGNNKIQTVGNLVSLLQFAPAEFAKGLGWTTPDAEKARDNLFQQLTGLVDDLLLNPPRFGQRGAWNPKNHP